MDLAVDLTPHELVTTVYLFRSARRGWMHGHGPLATTLERAQSENGVLIDSTVLLSLVEKHVILACDNVKGSDWDLLLTLNVDMADLLHV